MDARQEDSDSGESVVGRKAKRKFVFDDDEEEVVGKQKEASSDSESEYETGNESPDDAARPKTKPRFEFDMDDDLLDDFLAPSVVKKQKVEQASGVRPVEKPDKGKGPAPNQPAKKPNGFGDISLDLTEDSDDAALDNSDEYDFGARKAQLDADEEAARALQYALDDEDSGLDRRRKQEQLDRELAMRLSSELDEELETPWELVVKPEAAGAKRSKTRAAAKKEEKQAAVKREQDATKTTSFLNDAGSSIAAALEAVRKIGVPLRVKSEPGMRVKPEPGLKLKKGVSDILRDLNTPLEPGAGSQGQARDHTPPGFKEQPENDNGGPADLPMAEGEDLDVLLKSVAENLQIQVTPKEKRIKTPWRFVDGVELLEHQKIGVEWMMQQEKGSNKGGILADDMASG
jgi:SNF2 family DNA or RNA helicase